jgi:hypothetical protein
MINEYEALGGMEIGKDKPKYSEKSRPSASLPTTNLTLPDPESNLGRRTLKPSNSLCYYHVMNTNEGVEVDNRAFLISALDGDE